MRIASVILVILVSGCLSASETAPEATIVEPAPPPQPEATPPPNVQQGTASNEALADIEGYVRDSTGPITGATVRVIGTQFSVISDSQGGFALREIEPGDYVLNATGPDGRSTEREISTSSGDTTIVFLSLPDSPIEPEPEPEPVIPGQFQCPDAVVHEPFPTFGTGGAEVTGLVWASLKTGFRAVVAWDTPSAEVATLAYSKAGGAYVDLTEATPRTSHVFVIDNLPVGKTFCFQVPGAQTHAMRLGNAGTGIDERTGVYTTNLLVLANEGSDRAVIEEGLDYFANLLWDGTDGYVRSGINIVVFNEPTRHNSGWATCYLPGVTTPTCNFAYDVIFTLDAFPGGAASTYRDGINDPNVAMWMNWYWQAHPGSSIFSLDNPGAVLTHEMGHYMLGMMDMYPPSESTNSGECWIPGLEISIMGGSRDATEFDDEVNRCPNEDEIVQDRGEYVPSWTSMSQRYPNIPARTGLPDIGPLGDGGAYSLHVFDNVSP